MSVGGATVAFVQAQVWTLIGIVAAGWFSSLGLYLRLDGKIDRKIDELRSEMLAGFARLDAKIDALSERLSFHVQRHGDSG
jgi:roadblock/LC7 domain-containing protein